MTSQHTREVHKMKNFKITLELDDIEIDTGFGEQQAFEVITLEVAVPTETEETSTPLGLYTREVYDVENFKILDYKSDRWLIDQDGGEHDYHDREDSLEKVAKDLRKAIIEAIDDAIERGEP